MDNPKVRSLLVFLVFFLVSLPLARGDGPPVADARVGFSLDEVTQKYIYTTVEEKIYFDGSGSFDQDLGGGIKGYYWNFGDGYKDIGVMVEHSYSSPGNYTAKLMVMDEGDNPSLLPSEVEVFINPGLEAEIISPQEKGIIKGPGNRIDFSGEAEGGTPCYEKPRYKYLWRCDELGILSDEKEFSLPIDWPLGLYKITLEVTDCLEKIANDSIEIGIVEPLRARITHLCEEISPGAGNYRCDCEIRFRGEVRGGLPPYEVKWISLEDGMIDRFWIKEEGGSYTLKATPPLLAPLSNGTHTIRFEVTDSLGLKASDVKYEVEIRWCCALEAECETHWPEGEGPLVDSGNELVHSCDMYEVCHPNLWPLMREAVECCKWECGGDCHDKCNESYAYGEELGTTPEGLTLDGLKRCEGLYLIYGFGPEARYMADYFFPEVCCLGHPICWPLGPCCKQDLFKCRCIYHVYTKNQQVLSCQGPLSPTPPIGWSSDTAMNKNSCYFSDLPAHASILGDEGLDTEASGINTGTCCDYSNALTTALRIVGYKPDEVYSCTGPGHCFNLVLFPQEEKFHLVDTTGNKKIPWIEKGLPPGYPFYCSYFNCRNDGGTFPCPPRSQVYGC